MKIRSRNITVWVAFAVSLMALSITGDLRGQEPPDGCLDIDHLHGCVDSCTECGNCKDLCELEGCSFDEDWTPCEVDADYCPDGKIYWECACEDAVL